MSKEKLIIKEIAQKYYPDKNLKFLARHSHIYNVERLFEICLAYVGNYKRLGDSQEGYDFSDFSEAKTGSVRKRIRNRNGRNEISYCYEISNMVNKIGPVRACIYNPFTNKLDYFFFPAKSLSKLITTKNCVIKGNYNFFLDDYNKIEMYRVGGFKELAIAQDLDFSKTFPYDLVGKFSVDKIAA